MHPFSIKWDTGDFRKKNAYEEEITQCIISNRYDSNSACGYKKQEEPEMKEVEKTPSKGGASKPVPTTPTNKLEILKQENGISFADSRAVENIIF